MNAVKASTPVVNEVTQLTQADLPEWAGRQKRNVRLGLICGAIAMAVFLLAIWKIRIT
jgi:hypothetical protein